MSWVVAARGKGRASSARLPKGNRAAAARSKLKPSRETVCHRQAVVDVHRTLTPTPHSAVDGFQFASATWLWRCGDMWLECGDVENCLADGIARLQNSLLVLVKSKDLQGTL